MLFQNIGRDQLESIYKLLSITYNNSNKMYYTFFPDDLNDMEGRKFRVYFKPAVSEMKAPNCPGISRLGEKKPLTGRRTN